MEIEDGLSEPPADRAGHHRRTTLAVAAAAIGLALVGSFLLRQQRATEQVAPAKPAPTDGPSALPWVSAMVARDGRSVTVYAGTSAQCKELVQPQVAIAGQDGTQVTVAVQARVLAAVDCTTTGTAVPLVLSLPEPLGGRVLRDAASGELPPTYFERDLPGLGSDERWSPHPGQWASTDEHWYQGYNGPEGSHFTVSAGRTAEVTRPAGGAAVTIGAHDGVVTGAAGTSWTLWWTAGQVTYSLRLTPAEGSTFTLEQFRREVARLAWS
ncbi:hypothetical protein GCE86_27900 [Micromonospora terminaliae]|uniref:Uncharacterized protein n=1 Tax=Micromonospora terminaliae TaxID=1914461 RepID=A0AAJ3DHP3_9ACTN|nr:hypothetical protein [Micromonospora terminaliae]NES26326.1 hypothetical protein [Micromonospora terminaliae]QGL50506.1 hypothetical protein GCE86_27900 [Micromonospora terminaliae]